MSVRKTALFLGVIAWVLGMAVSVQAEARTLAELRRAVQGTSITLGFSSQPTLMDVVGVKTAELLRADFGVNAQYVSLDPPAVAAAVISGRLPVGEVSLGRIASMVVEGGTPLVFASNDVGNTWVVVARRAIRSVADLRGKVWGASSTSGITVALREGVLAGAGLTSGDLRVVVIGSTAGVLQAMLAGRLDAALLHVDYAAELMEKSDDFHILEYTYKQFPLVNDVWFADRRWVEANRDMALAITVASIKAARWARDNKEEFVAKALEYVPRLSRQVAEFSWYQATQVIGVWNPDGGLDPRSCETTIRISVETGAVRTPVACDRFVTYEFQEAARKLLSAP